MKMPDIRGMGISTNSQHKLNKMTRLELAAKHERIQVSRAARTRPRKWQKLPAKKIKKQRKRQRWRWRQRERERKPMTK